MGAVNPKLTSKLIELPVEKSNIRKKSPNKKKKEKEKWHINVTERYMTEDMPTLSASPSFDGPGYPDKVTYSRSVATGMIFPESYFYVIFLRFFNINFSLTHSFCQSLSIPLINIRKPEGFRYL